MAYWMKVAKDSTVAAIRSTNYFDASAVIEIYEKATPLLVFIIAGLDSVHGDFANGRLACAVSHVDEAAYR